MVLTLFSLALHLLAAAALVGQIRPQFMQMDCLAALAAAALLLEAHLDRAVPELLVKETLVVLVFLMLIAIAKAVEEAVKGHLVLTEHLVAPALAAQVQFHIPLGQQPQVRVQAVITQAVGVAVVTEIVLVQLVVLVVVALVVVVAQVQA